MSKKVVVQEDETLLSKISMEFLPPYSPNKEFVRILESRITDNFRSIGA